MNVIKSNTQCTIKFYKLELPSRRLIQVKMSDAKIISMDREIHFNARSFSDANKIADKICLNLK